MTGPASHPILTCEQAGALEKRLLADESAEWEAMQRAGVGLAEAVLRDFEEIGGFPAGGRILVLAGKGHNGGDGLIAAREILHRYPEATARVVFAFGERSLRPLAGRSWRELAEIGAERVRACPAGVSAEAEADGANYDICIDGIFGFQYRPPLPAPAAKVLRWANSRPVRLRAAVDLPSGGDEADAFRADFTYATGSVKEDLLASAHAGRIRYVDLGFFRGAEADGALERVLLPEVLAPLAGWRRPATDKRTYGHLFVLGGSRSYPGAVLMTVLAALRSGVGMLTAFVPESLVPAYAARAPEAMWVGWPEAPGGGLALEGEHLLREKLARASALVVGPGLGREEETLALAASVAASSPVPVVLDADALQPRIVEGARAPLVLTPHAGEFARIAGGDDLRTYAAKTGAVVVKKGPVTALAARDASGAVPVYHSFFGGPVLARGGSGDVLAGLVGGQLSQLPVDHLLAACRGVVWQGRAADLLARAHGQTAVTTTQILDFLPVVLRNLG